MLNVVLADKSNSIRYQRVVLMFLKKPLTTKFNQFTTVSIASLLYTIYGHN